jgi:hypothetical protein
MNCTRNLPTWPGSPIGRKGPSPLFALAALSDSMGGWVFWVLSLLFAIGGVWTLLGPTGKKLPDTK